MEQSILNTVKKILGLAPEETVFDLDVITHINTAFSTLYQLGSVRMPDSPSRTTP